MGTHRRRKRIHSEWYFQCTCTRCRDPTELGTFISALICEVCEEGSMLPVEPLDPFSEWVCSDCDFSVGVEVAERKVAQVHLEVKINLWL